MLRIIANGNLGKDPEVKYDKNGNAVAKFSLAAKEFGHTEWLNCVAFKKTAELVGEYCQKGSRILAEGTMKTSEYEKDGQKRYWTEIIVNRVEFLSPKDETSQGGSQSNNTQRGWGLPPADAYDDDINF